MRVDTTMSAAMAAAGMTPQRAHLRMQFALTVNRAQAEGVPADVIRAELRYAEERLCEGHGSRAADGSHADVATAQPTEGDAVGHVSGVGNGHSSHARPSPVERNATGHISGAANGGRHTTAHALRRDGGQALAARKGRTTGAPAREPSAVDIAAMRRVRQALAVTVLDTFRVRDGRGIGDVTFGELEHLRAENAREASVLRQLQRHAANVDPSAKVRDVVNIETLQRMIQRGAEVADAA